MSDQDPQAPVESPDTLQGQDGAVAEPELQDSGEQAPQEPARPFTPEQEQFMGSWMGRKIKEHIDKGLQPILERFQSQPNLPPGMPYGNHPAAPGPDPIKAFNENLRDRILDGDVLGAFTDVMKATESAKTNIAKQSNDRMVRAMTGYAEDPMYKEIYADAAAIAQQELAKGTPPEYAAELGFARAKLTALGGGSRRQTEGNPAMMSGGRPAPKTKEVKLPAFLKSAYERDKQDGLFKNEAEYIANLGPEVKAKYGL